MGIYNGVLCRVDLSINVGFCEVLDLREASKGEVVTVGIDLVKHQQQFLLCRDW